MASSTSESTATPPSFAALTALLDSKPQSFAYPDGETLVASAAEDALKGIFELALRTEASQYPLITSVLTLGTSDSLSSSLTPTPLDTLYTDGMDADQIWDQLELRSGKLCAMLEEIGMMDKILADEGREEKGLTREEKIERGIIGSDDEEEGSSEEEEGSEDDDSELSFSGMDDLPDSGSSGEEDGEEDDSEFDLDEEELGLDADVDGEERSLEFGEEDAMGMDMDDDEMDEDDDEEEEDEDEDDDTGRRIADLDMPGSRSSRKKAHPTLDDPFFSLHDFNRETEELEAFEVSNGKLGLDDDDDEEEDDDEDDDEDMAALLSGTGGKSGKVDMWANVEADDAVGTDEVKYADFFAPPAKVYKPKPTGANSKPTSGGKKPKSNAKPSFDEMDDDLEDGMDMDGMDEDDMEMEDDYDEDEAGSDDLEDGMDVTTRAKGDLFADDDEDGEDDSAPLSTHAKRLAALSAQIASLEQENVGTKPWALAGEAGSRSRPINAILEEDLEFESVGKQVPVVTEEKVKGLEEMIKKRILDNDFNDVVRRRPLDAKPFLPSRVFELSDQQSTKSLAQIYEDQYTASTAKATGKGGVPLDDRDGKLAKEHEEIENVWGDLCYKLDALSNANFTPKQPKAQIQTMSNLPSLSLETALPPTQRPSHLLAPEEVFTPPTASALTARSELTPAQKKALHNKEKKAKRKQRDALDAGVKAFGSGGGLGGGASRKKGKSGEKGAKEAALKGLVKDGKGVTVIGKLKKDFTGKGERKDGKGKGGGGEGMVQDGARLKL